MGLGLELELEGGRKSLAVRQWLGLRAPTAGGTGLIPGQGFPGGTSGKEPTCQCRRHKRGGFNPCVGKIPWRRKWQPASVFLPGESHGQLAGYNP